MIVTVLAPHAALHLAAGGVEWAVARPADLTKSHGVNITAKRLEEMADAYDPAHVEAAPVNFDHQAAGPAHGWVASVDVRGGFLWVKPTGLSREVTEGIRGGRYKRSSIEFTTRHPVTGGWYLQGLAVLGNAKPAIKALPNLRLAASRRVLQLAARPERLKRHGITRDREAELRRRYDDDPDTTVAGMLARNNITVERAVELLCRYG